jgi:hypothetical protein
MFGDSQATPNRADRRGPAAGEYTPSRSAVRGQGPKKPLRIPSLPWYRVEFSRTDGLATSPRGGMRMSLAALGGLALHGP